MSRPTVSHNLSSDDLDFIQRIASKIYRSGFVTLAVFLLEMGKPLSLLGSHAILFMGPILTTFIQADGYYRAAEIFEEPDHIELLIRELETLASGADPESGKAMNTKC
jgi:hypothetical protein